MDKDSVYLALGSELPRGKRLPFYEDVEGMEGKGLPFRQSGDLLFVQSLPTEGGRPIFKGKVGAELTLEEGKKAARKAAINALATVREALGSLNKIDYVVQLNGFIASAPGFIDQPKVLNGATELFMEVLGKDGEHTRAAIGCVCLPGDAPVQLLVKFKTKV